MSIHIKDCNSFFETDIWLNNVARDRWERLEIRNKDESILASFPIVKMKKYGCNVLGMPPFTQTLGLFICDTGAKLSKKLEKEKKAIYEIVDMLPVGYSYDFYLDINNEYVLPFKWKGFDITPCFTYRLEDISDLDQIWSGLKENIRTDIRKAQKKVIISKTKDVGIIVEMQKKTFERQGRAFPHDDTLIINICRTLEKYDAIDILYARDELGNIHSAALFVYDDNRCYYLMSGADPKHRKSGATSLIIWEGIKRASARGIRTFDFEGSMIEDIERFFRAFGANPKVYYHVTNYNINFKIMNALKIKAKKLLGYK